MSEQLNDDDLNMETAPIPLPDNVYLTHDDRKKLDQIMSQSYEDAENSLDDDLLKQIADKGMCFI